MNGVMLKQLHAHRSVNGAEDIAQKLAAGEWKIEDAMHIFRSGTNQESDRISWSIAKLADLSPTIVEPYLEELAIAFVKTESNEKRRNIPRILKQFANLHLIDGFPYDEFLRTVGNEARPVAQRVFCMDVCMRFCDVFPELKEELANQIENGLSTGSAAYRNHGNKLIKKLRE